MSNWNIEVTTDIHNRPEHNAAGYLRGFIREGATVKLKAELPEHMTDACLRELGQLIETWQLRAKGRR